MAWIYDVKKTTFSRNGHVAFKARYAGAGQYKNNPKFECLKNRGPLPRGRYRIVGIPFVHKRTGPDTLRLEPYTDNVMCGRGGFLIHGDSRAYPGKASEGCIILDREFRLRIYNSKDLEIIVV